MLFISSSAALAQSFSTAASEATGDSSTGETPHTNEVPRRPPLQMLRHKEDWSALRNPARRTGFFDPVKYVPLGGDAYAALGTDVRLRHEYFAGEAFAYGRPDDDGGFLLQRYMLHGDLHASRHFRLFAQLKSNVVAGQAGPPRPIDKDELDLHQLFAEFTLTRTQRARLALRAGRQEISWGRMVSFREGPNVRLSFDALRLTGETQRWQAGGLIARPVVVVPGVFDDGWNRPRETLWGARLQRLGDLLPDLAFYYLGQHRGKRDEEQGAAMETRHTAGLRLGTTPLRTSGFNLEGAVQRGTAGVEGLGSAIRAWFVAAEGARVFSEITLRPRLGLTLQAASGDTDPDDADLQAFRAPYPDNGLLGFALSSPVGIGNIYHVRPSLALRPLDALQLTLAWSLFGRQSTRGAVYGPSGYPLRVIPARRARFIGHMPRVGARLQIGRHATISALHERFVKGAFFDAAGAEAHASFWALQTTLRF